MNRIRYSFIICSVLASLCFGQSSASSNWSILPAIDRGQKIRIETLTAKYTGSFTSASEDSIMLDAGQGQVSIPRTDVIRVYSQSHSNRMRNTLIGAGIGTVIGAVTYGTLGKLLRNEGADNTVGSLLLPPIGVGAVIGAVIPTGSMKKIYDRKDETLRR
jgi:hypothetical protein